LSPMFQSDALQPPANTSSVDSTMIPAALTPPGPIHHIGVVVKDINTAVAAYRAIGFTGGDIHRVAEQNVDIATLHAGESWIEILAPIEVDSPIGSFLQKRGPGFTMSPTWSMISPGRSTPWQPPVWS
jgi:hypothetical protein